MTIKTKICGLTDEDAIDAAVSNGAEYIGFVFFPASPRNVLPERAAELAKPTPTMVKKVAVVVNPSDDDLNRIIEHLKPDYFQLHGKETPERVREIKSHYKIPIIKAISVRSADDIAQSGNYTDMVDMLLFDARVPESMPAMMPGGNGLKFDWTLLAGRNFQKPWILSGGLNISNIDEAVKTTNAKIIDASSSLEVSPGKKDPKLIKEFLEKVAGL